MDTTQIIILAAGKGTRMGGDIPKALTELGGQSMLEHVLDAVEKNTPRLRPIVVVGYMADMVKQRIGERAIYALQGEQKGTGHAVMEALSHIDPRAEQVLILYADQPFISAQTIIDLTKLQEQSAAPLSIATTVIEDDNLFRNQFYNFGRIVRDENNYIAKIIEAKDASQEQKEIREVNPAYFCCELSWMKEALETLENNNAQGEYYLTDLVNVAFKQNHDIEGLTIDEREALGANTKEQLAVLASHL